MLLMHTCSSYQVCLCLPSVCVCDGESGGRVYLVGYYGNNYLAAYESEVQGTLMHTLSFNMTSVDNL